MLKNNDQTFGSMAKFLHWTIAILIIIMLIAGYFMTGILLTRIHQVCGLFILLLVIFRLIWKFMNQTPKLPEKMPIHEKILAKVVQSLLYVLMFAMPISGWAMSTALGLVPHLGNISLPMPGIEINQAVGKYLVTVHAALAWGLVGCIGLHFIGALKHHFIEKDNVLKSMLPFTKE